MDWNAFMVADHKSFENARADIDGRAPEPMPVRIYEALFADAPEVARHAVRQICRPLLDHTSNLGRMCLNGDVAVGPNLEPRPQPDSQLRYAAQVRRHPVFLHSRVDQHVRHTERDQISQLQRRDDDMSGFGQNIGDLGRRLRPLAGNAVDLRPILKQGVVEGHAAADDRWERIMAQNNARPSHVSRTAVADAISLVPKTMARSRASGEGSVGTARHAWSGLLFGLPPLSKARATMTEQGSRRDNVI